MGGNGQTERKATGRVVVSELGKEFLRGLEVKFREFKNRGLLLAGVRRLAEKEVSLQQVKEGTRSEDVVKESVDHTLKKFRYKIKVRRKLGQRIYPCQTSSLYELIK